MNDTTTGQSKHRRFGLRRIAKILLLAVVGVIVALPVVLFLSWMWIAPPTRPEVVARASNDRYEIEAYSYHSRTEESNTLRFCRIGQSTSTKDTTTLWVTRKGDLATIEFLDSSRVKLVAYLMRYDPETLWRQGPAVDSIVVQLDEEP